MRKFLLLFIIVTLNGVVSAQTTPISAKKLAVFTVPDTGAVADTLLPYYGDLGVRRVIVADADGDGDQEIISTDYTNGGRVHVMEVTQDSLLEIVWSSPVSEASSGSTPRFPQVGDCDGDGKMEIIFEQKNYVNVDDENPGRIVLYEWNGTDWGTKPAYYITTNKITGAGSRENLKLDREVLTVYDFDGDGKDEIIPHGDLPRKDVMILGISGGFPGFATVVMEGGNYANVSNGEDFALGSFWNAFPADINGDGTKEIIAHHWDKYAFWSIGINGTNSYSYPTGVVDYNDAVAKGIYHQYCAVDANSYFGAQAIDVDGDGKDEIVGTQYGNGHALAMISFPETVTGNNIWTEASQTENYKELFTSGEIAALAGKSAAELWPIVKGDLNKDGKDEMYTGGGRGLNLVAIQYIGSGSVLDPTSYDMNLVYNGEGGEVFARYRIENGSAVYLIDTLFAGTDSVKYDTTGAIFDPSKIDTLKEETPFTSYIFADNVDLDNDGNLEIVLAEQSVYDSIEVNFFNWDTTLGIGQWRQDYEASYKIFNNYRQTVRVLEYDNGATGFNEKLYSIISPDDYKLEQNYPNPFNPTTTINFALPIDKKISMKIYDMLGQEVKTLINSQNFKKGHHEIMWDGTNNFGSKVASGNYIAKFEFGNFAKSIKMTLLK